MEWGQHVSEISCKATKTLCFLRRNLALAPRHTKEVAYKTLGSMQLLFGIPIMKLRQKKKSGESAEDSSQVDLQEMTEQEYRRRYVGRTLVAIPGGPQGEVFLNFLLQHPGTVSFDKDRYLTPVPNLRSSRASHDSQYTRYMAYSDALKNSFFPYDYGIVFQRLLKNSRLI